MVIVCGKLSGDIVTVCWPWALWSVMVSSELVWELAAAAWSSSIWTFWPTDSSSDKGCLTADGVECFTISLKQCY
jgi:hypothetical protein